MNSEQCWQFISERDSAADGQFVYGVKTTGIYCRPSCKSRQPRRENVQFFALPALAEQNGFRPCKRCKPTQSQLADERLVLVQAICDHIAAHLDQPDLLSREALSREFGYTAQHLQQVFKQVLALSPQQFEEGLRVQMLKRRLRDSDSVTEAIYSAGYNSASRVYEQASAKLGMTPATYRKKGQGMNVRYTITSCFLGHLLVASTERGICAVGIYDDNTLALSALKGEFAEAHLQPDSTLQTTVSAILDHIEGQRERLDLPLDVQATAFQQRVWDALRQIPRGETRSYTQLAEAIGQPTASRAVAAACAHIPLRKVRGQVAERVI